jgi:hypothetical protein
MQAFLKFKVFEKNMICWAIASYYSDNNVMNVFVKKYFDEEYERCSIDEFYTKPNIYYDELYKKAKPRALYPSARLEPKVASLELNKQTPLDDAGNFGLSSGSYNFISQKGSDETDNLQYQYPDEYNNTMENALLQPEVALLQSSSQFYPLKKRKIYLIKSLIQL